MIQDMLMKGDIEAITFSHGSYLLGQAGKKCFFFFAGQNFPIARPEFPPEWDGFSYAFLYFSLQITKFPGKELPILPVFSRRASIQPKYHHTGETRNSALYGQKKQITS